MLLVAGTLLSRVPSQLCPSSNPLNSLLLGQLERAQRNETTNPPTRLLGSFLGQAQKVRNAQQRALPRHSPISASSLGGAGIELLCLKRCCAWHGAGGAGFPWSWVCWWELPLAC